MGSLTGVSPIVLRARMRRWRRHAASIGLLLALVAAVAMHHAAPAMGDMHSGPEMTAAAEMCLGVFAAVGAAVVAVAFGLIALGRWRPAALPRLSGPLRASLPPQPRARPGPALLVVLCVSRR